MARKKVETRDYVYDLGSLLRFDGIFPSNFRALIFNDLFRRIDAECGGVHDRFSLILGKDTKEAERSSCKILTRALVFLGFRMHCGLVCYFSPQNVIYVAIGVPPDPLAQ